MHLPPPFSFREPARKIVLDPEKRADLDDYGIAVE
jgi:hypothetical protein